MGIFSKVKSLLKTKSSTKQTVSLTDTNTSPTLFALLGNDYKFGTQSRDYLLEAYGKSPYVFMVIDRITQRLVQIDKLLLNKNLEKIEDPEFLELLKNPNNRENGNSLLYRVAATYLATGEVFIIRKQELGEKDQYYCPINYNVQINEDTQGNVLNYWINMFNKSETYLKTDVLHIKKPDITIDTNHGFSTLRAIRKVWESNSEVWNSEAALHKNKGISGVLYSDGNMPLTDTEQEQLQKKYDQDYTNIYTRNEDSPFGKVKVSPNKLGYIQMGMNPNDLKSIEARIDHLRTICASFNVDSKLFNDPQASTYNNMAEAKRGMIIDAVIPLSKVILHELINFMSFSVFKNYSMSLDEGNIQELLLSKSEKSERLGREIKDGILTPEEARNMLYPELTQVSQ